MTDYVVKSLNIILALLTEIKGTTDLQKTKKALDKLKDVLKVEYTEGWSDKYKTLTIFKMINMTTSTAFVKVNFDMDEKYDYMKTI